MYEFAKLLLWISFGYALIAYYESPTPGIGISFSNLITDQTHEFANILDARSLELVFDHLDQLWQQFVQPDTWSILANLLYWLLLIVVTLAKVVSLAVVAFGLIASAVCALVGPIFVPFFIVPRLDWLFWSWLKACVQYSFVPVIANRTAFMDIQELCASSRHPAAAWPRFESGTDSGRRQASTLVQPRSPSPRGSSPDAEGPMSQGQSSFARHAAATVEGTSRRLPTGWPEHGRSVRRPHLTAGLRELYPLSRNTSRQAVRFRNSITRTARTHERGRREDRIARSEHRRRPVKRRDASVAAA
jgi:hypothetical protein